MCVCLREKEVRKRENAGRVSRTARRLAYCSQGSFVFPHRLFGFCRFSFFCLFCGFVRAKAIDDNDILREEKDWAECENVINSRTVNF